MRRIGLALAIAGLGIIGFWADGLAKEPGRFLPFTCEENADGSWWVWFVYQQSGYEFHYVSTKEIPRSNHFQEVGTPQEGDVAWRPKYMSLYSKKSSKYITADGDLDLKDLEKEFGPPKFFRYRFIEK